MPAMPSLSALHPSSENRTGESESVRTLVARARAHYAEMPGLSLTSTQACRLFGLDESVCTQVLATLRGEGLLRETPDGRFVLLD
jgi:hypothetical protein